MRKVSVLVVAMLVALMPLGFANSVCNAVDSHEYLKSSSAKLVRGVGNVALSWVEIFREPVINENKWEGVGRGFWQAGVRAVAGASEAVTSFIPNIKVPQPNPSCPTDLVSTGKKSNNQSLI